MPTRTPSLIAHHLVWTAYGTWLPNDPRGSGSKTVCPKLLADLGELHYGRRHVQPPRQQLREFYRQAEPLLKFPVLRFDDEQRDIIGAGLADGIARHNYTCYACAVMPDHVHLLIRKHRDDAETMIANLQMVSCSRLASESPPFADHPVWTGGGWKGFVFTPEHVRAVVVYIERNPAKEGLSPQDWPFVGPYDNWPFHRHLARSA